VVIFFFLGCEAPAPGGSGKEDSTPAPSSAPSSQLRSGDLVFQKSRSRQGAAIRAVTGSDYTHMGVLLVQGDKVQVFEAVQPVKLTPLSKWAARGKDGHFVVMRLKDADRLLTPEALARLRQEGLRHRGKAYDLRFDWSDREMYCSELVWKMYERALGIEIGALQRWSDLDLSSAAARRLAEKRLGRLPDPDGLVITPVRMMQSPLLTKVASR
jgi:cell wall-associated NlpC family hydrolase